MYGRENVIKWYNNASTTDGRVDEIYSALIDLIDEVNELRAKVEALEQKT